MSASLTTWRVSGMHCPACKATIERALRGVAGIDDVQVDYARGTLTASWNSDVVSEEKLSSILSDLGYTISRAPVNRHRAAIQAMCACAILIALVVLTTLTPLAQWLNAFPTAKAGMSLGALFIVGLFTSLHCVAMCGGIGISQTAQAARRGHRVSRSALLYNLGRVISYTATGAIVGALGTVLTISTPVKAAIQIVAAAFMLIMALRLIDGFGWLRRINLPRLHISLPRGQHSALVVGLLNGLMPCGPLQSMQLFALSAGGWLMGALSMLAFSLGTVPLMLGAGILGGRLNRRFARPVNIASAGLVALMGLNMLTNGLSLAGVNLTAGVPGTAAQLNDNVQKIYTELDYGSYPSITVQAGVPVEWTIHADARKINGCNNEIIIPAYDITMPLEPGDNVISFTPDTSGVIAYSCWMGMIRGSITVVDSADA